MFQYSERTDFLMTSAESSGGWWSGPDRLAMLYLLTYIDILLGGAGDLDGLEGFAAADSTSARPLLTGPRPRTGKLGMRAATAGFDRKRRPGCSRTAG
jgi:hypothetical protein